MTRTLEACVPKWLRRVEGNMMFVFVARHVSSWRTLALVNECERPLV